MPSKLPRQSWCVVKRQLQHDETQRADMAAWQAPAANTRCSGRRGEGEADIAEEEQDHRSLPDQFITVRSVIFS